MELSIGNKIKYVFPVQNGSEENCFIGTIENIGETFLTVRNSSNTILKITTKNFELIQLIEQSALREAFLKISRL
jgi:hypothetical protein